MKDYNIGLDIGTTSVGWAVVEEGTQKIIRKGKGNNRKALWGVRLFEPATTAEKRRGHRSIRRRYARRKERIRLLQEELKGEINKVDISFFDKLKTSKISPKDTSNKKVSLTKYDQEEIFSNARRNLNGLDKKYPTIYHLRNELINNQEQKDIRLVYLALHHMIKYRGNFLYMADNFNVNELNVKQKLKDVLDAFVNLCPNVELSDSYDELIDLDELSFIVVSNLKNDIKVNLEANLKKVCNNKKFISEFSKMVLGHKFSLTKLFTLEDVEKDISISFDGSDYDDKYDDIEKMLGDLIEVLDLSKQLYDCIFLKKIFKGSTSTSISSLMVEKYNQHKRDLRFLKDLFACDKTVYNKFFRNPKEMKKDDDRCLYEKYIHNKKSFEELKKELNNYISVCLEKSDIELTNRWNEIKLDFENDSFLPRVTDPENGKYPYQLNKDELIKILENQGKYYPCLLEKVNGKYKIEQILTFKIPYFVGPLVSNEKSKFAWMERKNGQEYIKITPYNFDEVVDKEKTAEKFILRMISHCTYILEEPALPNNSILYCRYKVMNELKQIKINGEKIKNDIQHKIMNELFMKKSFITDSKFKQYINTLSDYSMYRGDINVTGYSADEKFANNMQSYIDFFGENGIFEGTTYTEEDADNIIEWITIFDDKDILEKKVRNSYSKLSDIQIKKIISKKYSGWGNLSKKLLCTKYYEDKVDGSKKSILDLMEETDENFMQILNNDEYKFQEMIKNENKLEENSKLSYAVVENLATSPATKKGIYQALKVVDEIIKFMGNDPKNIMIEMARGEDKVKKRKDDKKKYLQKIYEDIKDSVDNYNELSDELNNQERIDSERLYLYFIQEGKCLYTGKPLDINKLSIDCEIDHIIPRCLIKDNSIDNKALVLKKCNSIKKDSLVLPSEYRKPAIITWWKHLKDNKLISSKKFYRLTRKEYKDEDIEGFINRQLVETRQITKHVANILNNFYKDTKIIYLNASLSHNYRERFELFKFRDINDYHHAYDAYLSAVLGEYKELFKRKNINYEIIQELNNHLREMKNYEQLNYGVVINSLDNEFGNIVHMDSKTGEILFNTEEFNKNVEDVYYRNDILISKKTEIKTGAFYDETKKKNGNNGVPLKSNMPIELYGSYTSLNPSYAIMIKYTKNNEKNKRMVGYPIYLDCLSIDEKISYYKKALNLKENDIVEMLDKKIPFYSLVNWNNQECYLVGASDKVEVCNAKQFKYTKDFMKKHKYTLNILFNKVKYENKEIYNNSLDEIITYIVNEIEKNYALFNNLIEELKSIVCYDDYSKFSIEEKEKIIKQLTLLLNCKSDNANFKFLNEKYSSAFGKKNGRIIPSCEVFNLSLTGLKENKYEF